MRRTANLIIILIILSCCLVGCRESTGRTQNVTDYFRTLCKEGKAEVWTHPDNEDTTQVWNAVRLLDKYAKGQCDSFPEHEIKAALKTMAYEQGYLSSHGCIEDEKQVNKGEVFLFNLMEQAAQYAPSINCISDFHSDDGNAGILYFPEWTPFNPLYSVLIYKCETGFKVQMIGEKGMTKIECITRMHGKEGEHYYLCSNNNEGVYFRQYLYKWDGKEMTLVCSTDMKTNQK